MIRTATPIVSVLLAAALVSLTACSDDDTTTPGGTTPPAATPPTTPPNPTTPTPPAATANIVDTAVAAGTFQTLVTAVQAAGLEETLKGTGPFTVFAPTDDAFGKLPDFLVPKLVTAPYKTELGLILKYHVLGSDVKAAALLNKTTVVDSLQGGKLSVVGDASKVTVNGVNVTTADIAASNGTIHVLDSVLLPTIVDTAVGYVDGATKFSTLVSALTAAELVETLSGPGPFTVFAPTDAAFDALKATLGETAFNEILADKPKLTKILTYHVLPAQVFANAVTAGDATTVEGGTIAITTTGGVKLNGDSNVVLTDLPNSNGVIHVIDKVLLPPDL